MMDGQNMSNKECMELLRKRMCGFFWKIAEEKESITIDGVPGYNEKAQFVGGKVINLCSYAALFLGDNEEERQKMKQALGGIIDMCSGMEMETWGILNALTGLYRLKTAGVYEEVVSRQARQIFQKCLDWHTFVDESQGYALIDKPTNYYGVAFGIARLRELLGWDQPGHSRILLDCLLDHISRYSGAFGFMDETKGEGRFDRYSILIPAEITELVLKTGFEEPDLIRRMLKKSTQIVLQMANEKGWGFSYGRSIGAYGETAALQILAAAARLGEILTKEEETLAFAYSVQIIRKMVLFWYDEDMQSINLWDKGRRTDGYRNKNRILGENLSLSMQMVDVVEQWERLGYDFYKEVSWPAETGLKEVFFTRFAQNECDRGLIIYRKNGHVWSLPLLSGGTSYYDKDPYLPVPRENEVLEAVPDVSHGALVPGLVMEDGTELMPICFFDSIEASGDREFQIRMSRMCQLGLQKPVPWGKEGEIEAVTTYRFLDDQIEREDVFLIKDGVPLKEIRLCFDTFSKEGVCNGAEVTFGAGAIQGIVTENYGNARMRPVESGAEDSFDTPHGPNQTQVCWRRLWKGESQLRVSWKLRF